MKVIRPPCKLHADLKPPRRSSPFVVCSGNTKILQGKDEATTQLVADLDKLLYDTRKHSLAVSVLTDLRDQLEDEDLSAQQG